MSLADSEVEALLAASGAHRTDFRDHVLLRMALGLGLRSCELVALDWAHVMTPSGGYSTRIDLRRYKGSASGRGAADQSVQAPRGVRHMLERFRGWQRREHAPDLEPLFTAKRSPHARLSERSVRKIWARWRSEAELSPRLGFHCLRHTFCQRLIDAAGGDLRQVQKAARHATINTTMIYTAPSDEQVARSIAALWE